jgi:hypothetical protein
LRSERSLVVISSVGCEDHPAVGCAGKGEREKRKREDMLAKSANRTVCFHIIYYKAHFCGRDGGLPMFVVSFFLVPAFREGEYLLLIFPVQPTYLLPLSSSTVGTFLRPHQLSFLVQLLYLFSFSPLHLVFYYLGGGELRTAPASTLCLVLHPFSIDVGLHQ